MSVKSPYNFVPISDTVIEYENSELVSHDIPFSDGLTGFIELKVITQSPTFIRNSGEHRDEFFQALIGKNHVITRIIPGTSLKGTIRNVLEIISFSKLNKVSDHRYSIRDLSNKKYTSKMTKMINGVIYYNVKAGWIKQKIENGEEKWYLTPCDFARVEISDLERYYKVKFNQRIVLNAGISSVTKYFRWAQSLSIKFDFKEGDYLHKPGKIHYKKVTGLDSGKYSGSLVFTGQPFPRNEMRKIGKHMEFIFFEEESRTIDVTHLKKEFEFIHSDENEEPNEELRFWSHKLEIGQRMPVFYLTDPDGYVESFGLAMMYRLPYPNKISDAIRNSTSLHFPTQDEKFLPDLSDVLFGYILANDKKNLALKGRIQFGHLIETENSSKKNIQLNAITKNLGSPKPTFYPYYVEQKIDRDYKVRKVGGKYEYNTFMDDNVKINGWKRYPSENRQPELNSVPNSRTTTTFIPIQTGSEFIGKIRFFNLRPFELGALLWAISYGNNSLCQHKIGMGKPLGFGRVAIEIRKIKFVYGENVENQQFFIDKFENYMSNKVQGWKQKDQIKELIKMADISFHSTYDPEYPILNPGTRINEFVKEIKNFGYALPRYSNAASKERNIHYESLGNVEKKKKR